jgi:hypothetical protein
MQIKINPRSDDFIPFTIDDLRREQLVLKDSLDALRKGFFRRYGELERERNDLRNTNERIISEKSFQRHELNLPSTGFVCIQ